MAKTRLGLLVVFQTSNAEVTEVCPDLNPDRASGERGPIADRDVNKAIHRYYTVGLSLLSFLSSFFFQSVLAGPISM